MPERVSSVAGQVDGDIVSLLICFFLIESASY